MSEKWGESPTAAHLAATAPKQPSPVHPAVTVGPIGRAWTLLVEVVGEVLDGLPRPWVLEAGARNRTLFDLPEDAYVVGVDRDPEALRSNIRLDQRVERDLSDYRPTPSGFDLISCWYVLDGMDDPASVLDRFASWAAEDGVIVLGVPNLRSPRGLAAWLTRKIRLRPAILPAALCRRFAGHGFTPAVQIYYEDPDQEQLRQRFRITRSRWTAVQYLVRVLTFGALDAARTDYIVVFRRTA